jgi:hypothetical protein
MIFKYRNPKGVTPGIRVSTGIRGRPPATSNGTVLEEVYRHRWSRVSYGRSLLTFAQERP